jgi:hypothetical protein
VAGKQGILTEALSACIIQKQVLTKITIIIKLAAQYMNTFTTPIFFRPSPIFVSYELLGVISLALLL